MKIGITGHQKIRRPTNWSWVRSALRSELSKVRPPLVGLTSLAIGADQLFAEIILEHGGEIEVIVPFEGYASKFQEGHNREAYHELLGRASRVQTLQKLGSDQQSYFQAGKRIVELADLILAVWDGKPAAGLGGTADIVQYAEEIGRHWIQIDPDTCTVTKRAGLQ